LPDSLSVTSFDNHFGASCARLTSTSAAMKVRDLSPAELAFCKKHIYLGSPAEKAYLDKLLDLLSEYQAVQRFADSLWTTLKAVVGVFFLETVPCPGFAALSS
jgi:hypothetical protein